jgi:hypothetical protein
MRIETPDLIRNSMCSYEGLPMPTSIAFNPGNEFLVQLWDNTTAPAVFLVAGLDAAIHAWHPNLVFGTQAENAINVVYVHAVLLVLVVDTSCWNLPTGT